MSWSVPVPLLAAAILATAWFSTPGALLLVVCVAALLGAVTSAVHHAEVIAHRVGEPFGTLVLALAITVIEAALVLAIMLAGASNAAAVARDTIYSAVMIICNGVVGICVLLGGLHHREQSLRIEGTYTGLAALAALSALVLVIPALTTSAPGGWYTASQLLFVGASSLALWGVFAFIQTVRHRDDFLPETRPGDETVHAPPPTPGQAWACCSSRS
jgi:Ca2+:H+ antiporter